MNTLRSLILVLLMAVLMAGAYASAGDLWSVRGNLGGHKDLLRVTSAGHFLAGQNGVQNVGSNSVKWNAIYANDVRAGQIHLSPVAVTSNTTLTTASGNQVRIGSLAANITLTLPSAAVAENGAVIDVQDVAGTLDSTHTVVVVSTSGNINGSANTTIATAYSGKRFISDGTNWFAR